MAIEARVFVLVKGRRGDLVRPRGWLDLELGEDVMQGISDLGAIGSSRRDR
jgi:hypothetical protein